MINIILKIFNRLKHIKNCIFSRILYPVYCKKFKFDIINDIDAVDYIINERKSIARFGDGEFKWMLNIPQNNFQKQDPKLAEKLKEVMDCKLDNLLIGIPRAFNNLDNYNKKAKNIWKYFIYAYGYKCRNAISNNRKYIDTNITRCYIDYEDKKDAEKKFDNLKRIWEQRDIVIIEGEKSKLGVGNDLFDNAKSIRRILAPSSNAFDKIDLIITEVEKLEKNSLILLSLGPTATVLAYELCNKGYQAIDIGHIDIEYEWYNMNAQSKVPVNGKFVNEAQYIGDLSNENICDNRYENSIISNVTNMSKHTDLVSVVIPTYNRSNEKLQKAIESVINQTYSNIEILVIDDNANNLEEREKAKKIISNYPGVKYFENEKNLGGALTRNCGIDNAKGKYIAFLDDDDEFFPKKVEKQIELFKEKEKMGIKVGMVYCYKNAIDTNYKVLWNSSFVNFEGNCLFEHMRQCIETTSTWFCSKEALIEVGKFENVRAHQDNILLMKLLASGYEIFRVPEVLLNFYFHGGNGITNKNKNYIEYTKYLIEFKKQYYNKLTLDQIEEVNYFNSCMLFDLYLGNKMKKEAINELKIVLKNNKFRKHTIKMMLKILV